MVGSAAARGFRGTPSRDGSSPRDPDGAKPSSDMKREWAGRAWVNVMRPETTRPAIEIACILPTCREVRRTEIDGAMTGDQYLELLVALGALDGPSLVPARYRLWHEATGLELPLKRPLADLVDDGDMLCITTSLQCAVRTT